MVNALIFMAPFIIVNVATFLFSNMIQDQLSPETLTTQILLIIAQSIVFYLLGLGLYLRILKKRLNQSYKTELTLGLVLSWCIISTILGQFLVE